MRTSDHVADNLCSTVYCIAAVRPASLHGNPAKDHSYMHADEDKVLSGAPEHVLAIWHVLDTQHCEHATDACGATHPDDLNRAASLWKVHVQVAI